MIDARGAERGAGGFGRTRRLSEVVWSLPTAFAHGGARAVAQRLARALSTRLAQAGQRAARGGRGGRDSPLRGARPALRRRSMGPANGRAARPGIGLASAAPPKEARRWSTTPRTSTPAPLGALGQPVAGSFDPRQGGHFLADAFTGRFDAMRNVDVHDSRQVGRKVQVTLVQ